MILLFNDSMILWRFDVEMFIWVLEYRSMIELSDDSMIECWFDCHLMFWWLTKWLNDLIIINIQQKFHKLKSFSLEIVQQTNF